MMRSLSSGVAGLRTHQTKLDVIGNNIANVNTNGFKASRTTFADVYYQNLSTSNRATDMTGGKNPTQIGYGASIATVDVMNTVTGMTSTDRALDVYIAGDGFLVSKDASGKTQYSRLGNMFFDGNGNLVDGSGHFIQGFPQKEDGSADISADGTITGEQLTRIHCDTDILDRLTGISISNTGAIVGILPGDSIVKNTSILPTWASKENITVPPDSNLLGDLKFIMGALPTEANLQTALGAGTAVTDVKFGDVALDFGAYQISVEPNVGTGKIMLKSPAPDNTIYEGYVKADGTVTLYNSTSKKTAMTFKVTGTLAATPTTGTPATTFTTFPSVGSPTSELNAGSPMKYQITTKDKGENIVQSKILQLPNTGLATGTDLDCTGIPGLKVTLTTAIAANSKFYGSLGSVQPDESELINIGNLVVAKFRNPSGMSEAGNNYFDATNNSGDAIYVKPGIEGTGTSIAGALEMSNVEVSKEFTDMITTQRGFQANSRIITVSDEMLQELVNLKR